MKSWPILILLVLLGCGGQKQSDQAIKDESKKGDILDISLNDLAGNEIKISDHKGKVVFLNFWSTWCKPCIKEMPSIERAMKILSDKDVVFLAASDESVEKIEKFRKKYDFSFEYIQLKDDYASLDIYSLPTTIIYDRAGQIVLNEAGARDWDADDMIEKLSSL